MYMQRALSFILMMGSAGNSSIGDVGERRAGGSERGRGRGRGRGGEQDGGAGNRGGRGSHRGGGHRGGAGAENHGGDDRGGAQGGREFRGTGGNDPERRFFDAVVRSGEFQRPDDPQRFMRVISTYEDKLELLMRLTNDKGPTVLKKAITRSVTQLSGLAVYVLPLFRWLGSDELCGMMCRPQVRDIAKNVMETPGLLSLLRTGYEEHVVGTKSLSADVNPRHQSTSMEQEICLAWFIHLCCVEFPEARKDTHNCYKIALAIIKRKHVLELCEELTIVLGLDNIEEAKGGCGETKKQKSVNAKTIKDLEAMQGGRHDNDPPDFRDVSVMPSVDELKCTQRPHLPGPPTSSCSAHLERHFRLLREDLLGPARTELQLFQKGEGDRRKRFSAVAIESVDVNTKDQKKAMVVVSFALEPGHKTLLMTAQKDRVSYWESYSTGMLPINCLVLLMAPDGSEAFATVIHREARELAGLKNDDYRPRVGLRFEAEGRSNAEAVGRIFKFVGRGPVCNILTITSSYFSYAPVLNVLQKKDRFALSDIVLNPADYHPQRPEYLSKVPNLESFFPESLNPSQRDAMQNAFGSELALIQGPPGTGKTYIERAIIELIYRHTNEVILLEAYTNHALDQVLEGLLDKGIGGIVRIGERSKSTKLGPYTIRELIKSRMIPKKSGFQRRAATLYEKREIVGAEAERLAKKVNMNSQNASWIVISEYLRLNFKGIFKELNCSHLCGGSTKDEFQMVGKDGKQITPFYLWDLWRKGSKPLQGKSYNKALFKNAHSPDSIWNWSKRQRLDRIQDWIDDMTGEDRVSLAELLAEIREINEELHTLHKEPMYEVLMDKQTRIIGVTSTGASLNADMLATVKPGVVIGEEAGELLEAHLLAGTHKSVKHMILIGDHKQLRPKIENYELSVVSGNGHDLNCSLFERLVHGGLHHSTLLEQHRMHPEIAAPIMELSIYPGLTNYPQTETREKIRGIAMRICFIDHREPEHQNINFKAQTDTSKSNLYEAELTAYICRYLIQQGYKGSDITVLTTYLGQVIEINKQLNEILKMDVDINDRDIKDLTAGGMDVDVQNKNGQKRPDIAGKKTKMQNNLSSDGTNREDNRIRVSTVDNYQGEENKIVVVSLVRSNSDRQIGFLKEPERLTVLLSRAQCLQILIGNGECLRTAKNAKGAEWWDRLLSFLEKQEQVVPGLPVKCASHDCSNMLGNRDDFENLAPNGGCILECTAMLPCGHRCPLKCHAFDSAHTSVRCIVPVPFMCGKGHKVFGICSDVAEMDGAETFSGKDVTCNYCEVCNEITRIEKAREKDLVRIQTESQKKLQQEYMEQASAEREIEEERLRLQESREKTERMRAQEKRAFALEKIKRERELEDFCRNDEVELLIKEEEEKMEQELAETERQIAMKNEALARKVQEFEEQRRQRDMEKDIKQQDLANSINQAWQRGEQSLLQAKRDNEVSAEQLAPLWLEINEVLHDASETGGKKVDLIKAILEHGESSSARLKLVAKGLGMRSAADLTPFPAQTATAGQQNKHVIAYLDAVSNGKHNWIQTRSLVEAQLRSSHDADLELFHCFVTLQMLNGTHNDAELARCRQCLASYAGADGSIKSQKKKQTVHVPKENKASSLRHSVFYNLLAVTIHDTESQGNPSLSALREALRLFLHPDLTVLSGITDLCLSYLRKHVGVMTVYANLDKVSSNKSAVEKRRESRRMHARRSKALTELENKVGLESIKNMMAQMSARIDLDRERGVKVEQQQMNMRFDGNPGTGKTTVARIYGDFLKEKGVLGRESIFKETNGAKLISDGVDKLKKLIEEEMNVGGILFVDEAYQLNPKTNPMGGQILDYLLPEMENRRGTLVVVIAGYSKPMDDLMAFNEGLPSRFPERMIFDDYTEFELLQILMDLLRDGSGSWKLADEKHARIAARRLARQSGTTGFGNARAVRNLLDLAKKRQASRVLEERQQGGSPDIFLIQRSDLLGPANLDIGKCQALSKLQSMRGLQKVKQAVQQLINLVQMNSELEELEKKVRDVNLNKVFVGNPGTGKTTVAKFYAEILNALGLLSKGEVIVKNPQDFTGEHLGQSEAKTKAILDSAKGCVLVIDEAYGLYGGKNTTDPYKIAVVDTIVAEVQGVPGDDRCVLLLGYKKEMEEMMRNTNPGLARRFNLQEAFYFEDYSDEDLLSILMEKVHQLDMEIDVDTALEAVKVLAEQRRTDLHFGNGGAIENLLSSAKERMMTRLKECSPSVMAHTGIKLLVSDFSPLTDFTEGVPVFTLNSIIEDPTKFVEKTFAKLIGCDSVKEKVKQFISMIAFAQKQGQDPLEGIELNFFFAGPPGTGKTTVARIMGGLLKALGLIPKDSVTECSASDFSTGFVGQSGKQTREIFRAALGGVLFIDEAYRLHPEKGGVYMREVLDEIVQILTEPAFKNNMAVIVAGYEEDMTMLFQVNQGLKSRIQTTVKFEQFTAEDSERYLKLKLREKRLQICAEHDAGQLLMECQKLVMAPHWSNGRDIDTLATDIYQKHAQWVMDDVGTPCCKKAEEFSEEGVVDLAVIKTAFRDMIDQKRRAGAELNLGENNLDRAIRQLQLPRMPHRQAIKDSAAPVSAIDVLLAPASDQLSEPPVTDSDAREEVLNHFVGFDSEFLLDIQGALESLGIDVDDLEQVASFDVQTLASRFGKNFDLVREWNRKIQEVWKQAKRLEEELARKKRAQRPKWRCAICGRPHCQVAPYIEGYEDVED